MSHPYDALTPDTVVDCVETLGYRCDLRLIALNSYENRVYQVGIEDDVPIIAKFYRAERWSDAQILEEHSFTLELTEHDISVVAPMPREGETLHKALARHLHGSRDTPGAHKAIKGMEQVDKIIVID